MRKGKLLRSVLAAGMAAALLAVPMGVSAETIDETEFLSGLEEAVEDSVDELAGSAYAMDYDIVFGDGLYNTVAQDGTDISWMQEISGYAKIVSDGNSGDAEMVVRLNDTQLCTLLVSVDADGTIYVSVPELFDQAIAINAQEFAQSVLNGSSGGGFNQQIVQMIVGKGIEIAGQIGDYFASLPAEVWQQELSTYLTPVLTHLGQETGTETVTVGSLSADVNTQTYTIPSESMGEIVSGILDSLSKDQVIGSLLQSDAVSSICDLVSFATGGQVKVTGQELLDQFQGTVGALAQSDFSSIPGIAVTTKSSEDGNANGFSIALKMGEQAFDLLTAGAIADGEENAFEITPGAMLLSLLGMDAEGTVDILGTGSTSGYRLNEEVNVLVNGESVAVLTIKDFDLEAIERGDTIGTFRAEADGVSAQITYNVEEDGARTIEYLINDEVFYNAAVWAGPTQDTEITQIDKENALKVATVDDINNWIGTFNAETFVNLLTEAGVPAEQLAA